jgi:hypothetical protein
VGRELALAGAVRGRKVKQLAWELDEELACGVDLARGCKDRGWLEDALDERLMAFIPDAPRK